MFFQANREDKKQHYANKFWKDYLQVCSKTKGWLDRKNDKH